MASLHVAQAVGTWTRKRMSKLSLAAEVGPEMKKARIEAKSFDAHGCHFEMRDDDVWARKVISHTMTWIGEWKVKKTFEPWAVALHDWDCTV